MFRLQKRDSSEVHNWLQNNCKRDKIRTENTHTQFTEFIFRGTKAYFGNIKKNSFSPVVRFAYRANGFTYEMFWILDKSAS